ncbi:MAG: hypothetical protein AAF480_16255 [Actinomycetota bacterium]
MSIRPGEDWGADRLVPVDTPIVSTDAALASAAAAGHDLVALEGGDMWRTLGGRGGVASRLGTTTWVVPVDLATVVVDDEALGLMAAHVIARRIAWRGEAAAVMNAQWWGTRDMAPRSHPGDGRLDTLVGAVPFRQLLQARGRVGAGQHVPHPAITTGRPTRFAHTFERTTGVWIDGVRRSQGCELVVEVVPNAVSVAV